MNFAVRSSLLARIGASTLSLAFALCACDSNSDDNTRSVEPNELGITELKVDRHTTGNDRFLEISGLDANGEEIAKATLRIGTVAYAYEPGSDPQVFAAGTELTLTAQGATHTFTSPDREVHDVFIPQQPKLASFAALRDVQAEIYQEAGIGFTQEPASTGEDPYFVSTCNGNIFPVDKGSPSQCCRNDYHMWHKIASGTNLNKLAYRTYYANVCRTSSGGIGCTTDCYYGPCGGHVETISSTYVNNTAAAVFYPTNTTTNCGADSDGTGPSGYTVSQAYTGGQTLYPGVTATCPYDGCGANGYPTYSGPNGFWMTLTASCDPGGRGTIGWNGNNVTCNGNYVSQSFWAPDYGQKAITRTIGLNSSFCTWDLACAGTPTTSQCYGYWTTDMEAWGRFAATNACWQ
jgi:hypothetical protein